MTDETGAGSWRKLTTTDIRRAARYTTKLREELSLSYRQVRAMTDEQPQARREDYWEGVEDDAQTVLDQLRDDADEYDVLAVDVAGSDESVLFLLVLRRKVNEGGNLILSERYYRYDTDERQGTWLSNGIERRINGSLATVLKVVYSALSNGDLDADSPMLVDSRGDGLDYQPDELTTPVGTLEADDVENDRDRDPRLKQSASGEAVETVECEECGGNVERADAINLGGALGSDVWVCEGTHVERDTDG
jgi:hypothetical protein